VIRDIILPRNISIWWATVKEKSKTWEQKRGTENEGRNEMDAHAPVRRYGIGCTPALY